MTRKVGFHTLGCKLNFSETSTIARAFEAGGFERSKGGEQEDICVINSCSVTEHAEKKCRNLVRKLVRAYPDALIVVTGCYAQLRPEDLTAIEGVDLVIGNHEKGSIYDRVMALGGARKSDFVEPLTASAHRMHPYSSAKLHTCEVGDLTHFFAAFSSGDRTRSYLKVQDGCDYHCSYCTIPMARGASRNLPIVELADRVREIAASGQREVVLTGINVGDFGRTTGESFVDLLKALDQVEGIERYRISSIEPNLLTDEIIAFTAGSSKFQPHFHIPLQSGADSVLARMRRRYTTEGFAQRLEAVRRRMPDAFFGVDVIVGFPGETEQEFETTYLFIKQLRPAFLHVFPYSARPHTPAAELKEQVSPQIIDKRVKKLAELSEQLHRDFCCAYLGQEATVLWESTRHGGDMMGYTGNYIRVRSPFQRDLINTFSRVWLHEPDEANVMRGTILEA